MMAIKASLAGSRADCVRERLRDCGPGAIQRRQPRREGRLDVERRLGQGGGRFLTVTSGPLRRSPIRPLYLRRIPAVMRRQARAHQTNSASGWLYGQREAAVVRWRRLSSDSPRIRWTPCSSARRASDPESRGDAREKRRNTRREMQASAASQVSVILPLRSLPGRRPLLLRASKIALAVLMGTGCDASLIGDETPWVLWRLAAGGENGSSIGRPCGIVMH